MPQPTIPAEISAALAEFARRWSDADVGERQAFQPWLMRFCEALQVPSPRTPPTDDDGFERHVTVTDRSTGDDRANYIDYWKAGHVAIEAKASGPEPTDRGLRKAFGQLKQYVAEIGSAPPYIIVVDVPSTLIVWDHWNGPFGGFAAGRRIALKTLHERPDDIALLRDIFTNPSVRDPRGRAQTVSREIAGKLAILSATLEGRGFDQERVARFLMRCVFCFFAEDVELLPKGLFKETLERSRTLGRPEVVEQALTSLWRTMDTGGMFGSSLLHRFNGHFFKTVEALPLEPADVTLMIEAAGFDWSHVEPSIFGTLLVRALDAAERHRLGAEYTPREYIERLVEPTVVEPIRERWTAVQAVVLQLEATTKKKDRESAIQQLRDFHAWLRSLSFLDPACGSGNFLYVTMAAVKRIELEVIHEIERVGGKEQKEAILDEVHPRQFYGIEIKPWAREIAELTLWIGYHQFWREAHGGRTPPDPILEDTGTIQCRDAVLAYDSIVHRPEKDRPDPTPRITSPVTGELIPDPTARLKYIEYMNPRPAEWPRADFIVGNPP
ncbi:MAG: DNA methyltransferase, partial [Gemmatimonadales bacterium]